MNTVILKTSIVIKYRSGSVTFLVSARHSLNRRIICHGIITRKSQRSSIAVLGLSTGVPVSIGSLSHRAYPTRTNASHRLFVLFVASKHLGSTVHQIYHQIYQ
jgi:hypothetical protein